jgi:hypothetical protein
MPKAIIPDDWTLQVDLDSRASLKKYLERLNFFRARLRSYSRLRGWMLHSTVKQSATRGHFHVTIRSSDRLTVPERIAAQALLGSDPNREIYNFFRHLNGSRFPILFYEKGKP